MSDWGALSPSEPASFSSGGTPSKRLSDFEEGDIPWIRVAATYQQEIRTSDILVSHEGLVFESKPAKAEGLLLLKFLPNNIVHKNGV